MKKTDRRSFLSKAGVLGLAALSGTALLQACSGGVTEKDETSPAPTPAAAAEKDLQSTNCEDHNKNLSDADLEVRRSIGYSEISEQGDQNCSNCRFYLADKFEGDCGACQLFVNGSVNPNGWCKSWAAN